MKTLKNILFLACILFLKSNYAHAFSHPSISFDIEYGIELPSNPGTNEIHVVLEELPEVDETQESTIYYLDYTPNGADIQVYAYFSENVEPGIVSVYNVSNDKIAIRINKIENPPFTLGGAILFVVKDDIIKPIDSTPYSTAGINDIQKGKDSSLKTISSEKKVILYPNPANQTLKLPQDNAIKNVYFVNVLSNKTTLKMVNQATMVNVQDLNEGIYLVKLEGVDGKYQWLEQKLVIKH